LKTKQEGMPRNIEAGGRNNADATEPPRAEFAKTKEETWSATAKEAITKQGLTIEAETPPYKSFGEGERFFIQKCANQDGEAVVVKISDPSESGRKFLERESGIYDALQEMQEKAEQDGEKLKIDFPKKLGEFTAGEQKGLVVNFLENDPEAKAKLSPQEKTQLVVTVVKEMHKLEIPQAELDKPYNERIFEVLKGEDFVRRWEHQIPDLLESGLLSEQDSERLLQLIKDNKDLINTFPLKIEHGDVHGGNIAYSVDGETGEESIALMDWEALKAVNEFSEIARISIREDGTKEMPNFRELLKDYPKLQAQVDEAFGLLKQGGAAEALENDLIDNNDRPDDAKTVYQLMKLHELIGGLHVVREGTGLAATMKRKVYEKILEETLENLPS